MNESTTGGVSHVFPPHGTKESKAQEVATVRTVVLQPMPADVGTPPESRLGERLRDCRQQLELSVEALSRLTKLYDVPTSKGISPPTLARYEAGDTLPNLRELRLLAESLDVPVQWLVDGSLPNMKGQQEGQALLAALRAYIRLVQAEGSEGTGEFAMMEHFFAAQKRAAALEEARRPSPHKS